MLGVHLSLYSRSILYASTLVENLRPWTERVYVDEGPTIAKTIAATRRPSVTVFVPVDGDIRFIAFGLPGSRCACNKLVKICRTYITAKAKSRPNHIDAMSLELYSYVPWMQLSFLISNILEARHYSQSRTLRID